jgi:hypothetical protein
MQVDRIKQGDQVFYLLTRGNLEQSAFTPRELMQLLIWLQEHEDEIIQDAFAKSVNDEMKGMELTFIFVDDSPRLQACLLYTFYKLLT